MAYEENQNILEFRQMSSLNAIKGFESAARLLNLREAAQEMHLTHSAISHQIKNLEESLGVKLFNRVGRNIALSEAGEIFYPYVREALCQLAYGVEEVLERSATQPLRIHTYVTMSIRWLARRLPAFHAAHPDIHTRLSTYTEAWAFDEENADVGIVYFDSVPPSRFFWQPLFDYCVFPVCSPTLLNDYQRKLNARDLLNLPLLSVSTEIDHWKTWFESAGIELDMTERHMVVDTKATAIEMALNNEGVVLVNGPFVNEDLNFKRLIKAVNHEAVFPGAWGVICRKEMADDTRVSRFISWLIENTQQA